VARDALVPWVIPLACPRSAGGGCSTDHSAFNYIINSLASRTFHGERTQLGALLVDPRQRVVRRSVLSDHGIAALKSWPEQLYEAASIDGANAWQKFVHITCR